MSLFHRKNKELELELPPPPPPDSDMDFEKPKKFEFKKDDKKLEELPSFKGDLELPPLPPIGKEEMHSLPDLDGLDADLPPVPDLDELENDLPPLREIGEKEFPRPEFQKIEVEEEPKEIEASPVKEEKKVPNTIFVNVNTYRDALDCVNQIRNRVKDGENYLQRLDDIKNSKDKYFEQFRAKLEDLQRKNIYVDKSLFEREVFEK